MKMLGVTEDKCLFTLKENQGTQNTKITIMISISSTQKLSMIPHILYVLV